MSTTILGAHTIHEHIQDGRFVKALSVINETNPSLEACKEACIWVLDALKRARKSEERDRGFLILVPRLIAMHDAKHAIEAIEVIEKDLDFSTHLVAWREQLEAFAEQQQHAIRECQQPAEG